MRAAWALILSLFLGPVWAQEPPSWHGLRPGAAIGGPLDLIDQLGRPFSLARLDRPLALLAFGYTHCPDICPDTLSVMRRVAEGLPAQARPALIFVTLDPQRDTPAVLKDYLDWFDAGIVGLTGEADALRAVAERYRVGLEREEDGAIAHSAYLYLIDTAGRVLLMYPFGTRPEAVLDDLRHLYARGARRRGT